MYLAHEADVAEAVLRFIQGTQQCETAVTVAHGDFCGRSDHFY